MSSSAGSTNATSPPIAIEGATMTVSVGKLTSENIIDCMVAVCEYFKREKEDRHGQPQSSREWAHEKGLCHSEINGEQPVFAFLGYNDIRSLEGRLLTIVDAAFSDQQQRKAFKDLVRNAIWFDWAKYLDTDTPHVGKPDLR